MSKIEQMQAGPMWLNPQLPSLRERTRYPLHVEIVFWLDRESDIYDASEAIDLYFGDDSILAAIEHFEKATLFHLYSAARDMAALARYLRLRWTFRPSPVGLRTALDVGWQSLTARGLPWRSGAALTRHPPAALRSI